MGELILCNQMMTTLPYYIAEASRNIYSLEELSYYIENNLYLIEVDFMSEELCTWIDKELGFHPMAEKLREIYRGNGTLSEFVECILAGTGYLSADAREKVVNAFKDMENKSEFECIKLKADRYVENKRYINAIYEYRKLLLMKDEANEILIGNVWHNLGCAYVGLFLFREAAMCFRRAYELNQNQESMRECLYAYRCMHDENGLKEVAEALSVDEEMMLEVASTLTEKSRMEEICHFEEMLDDLFLQNKEQEVGQIVADWKETYRKNCRI